MGHIIKDQVPTPEMKLQEFSLSRNPSSFFIHNPFFSSLFSSISTVVLVDMLNILLPCLCVGCSIFWALLPEASLRDVLCPPTPSELLSRVMERMADARKNLERIIDVIREGSHLPTPEAINEMFEASEVSQPELPVESPNDKSKETLAVLLSILTLAMMLTFASAEIPVS